MLPSEKFCLKWNDFQENITAAFVSLREDTDFTDITLSCEDGHQIVAHKIVLAASSPFFQNMLRRNKHAHPVVYMRGVKSEDLAAIVDFLYYGEANIYQQNLETFLNLAEELKLKGLNRKEGDKGESEGREAGRRGGEGMGWDKDPSPVAPITNTARTSILQDKIHIYEVNLDDQLSNENTVALPKQEFCGELKALDEKVRTLMMLGENMVLTNKNTNRQQKAHVCQVCGKEGQMMQIRDHIEANHIEGIYIPCNNCEKSFRSRSALRTHTVRIHKIII